MDDMCYDRRRAEACVDESGTREEPGTLTQGAPVFPGSSRLGIEPKTPGWLVQDPTTRPIGDLLHWRQDAMSGIATERNSHTERMHRF